MVPLARGIEVGDDEVELAFVRASGPGGQNVNKVSTAVQLRFDVARSPSLPPRVRDRLIELSGSRLTRDGVLVLTCDRHRTQARNREDAWSRLRELVDEAAAPPPPKRRPTRPGLGARTRRMDAKSRRGAIKAGRSSPRGDD